MQKVHGGKCADNGGGQRQCGNDGRSYVAQKQEDNKYHQRNRQQQGELYVIHRLTNRDRSVVQHVEVYRGRQLLAELWQ